MKTGDKTGSVKIREIMREKVVLLVDGRKAQGPFRSISEERTWPVKLIY